MCVALLAAIEAGELDASPGQYGMLSGSLALAESLLKGVSSDT
jgi:hypothetical protein